MKSNTLVKLKPEVVYSKIDNEVVLLTMDSGKYLNIDAIGSDIWEYIKEEKSIDEVVTYLLAHYEVSKEQCTNEVIDFLNTLNQDDLINIKNA